MRHCVARSSGDVGVEVGAGVGPVRGGRLEDAGCWMGLRCKRVRGG